MTTAATKQAKGDSSVLPSKFVSAVIRFDGVDDAAAAFDVLARGGQYGVVGKCTYVVTPYHILLLNGAKLRYEVESFR